MVWLPLNACFICFVLFAFLNDVNSQSGQTEINSVEDIKCCRKLNSDFVTGFNSLLYNAKPIVFRQPEIKGGKTFLRLHDSPSILGKIYQYVCHFTMETV